MPNPTETQHILVVDDIEEDVLLMREAIAMGPVSAELHHVGDGKECLRYLRREGPYAQAPEPALVLLDLNMPGMDGRETLRCIWEDEDLRHVPVVILSSSTCPDDVRAAYRSGCRSYLIRPVDFTRCMEQLEVVLRYWLHEVERPQPTSGSPL